MEVGFELEDDLFFADLNRQISLLIKDDDDDEDDVHIQDDYSLHSHYPDPLSSLNQDYSYFHQVMGHDHHNSIILPQTLLYHNHHNNNVPLFREHIRGTGVFIPKQSSSQPRKNNNNKQQTDGRNSSSSSSSSYTNTYSQNHPIGSGLMRSVVPYTAVATAGNSSHSHHINGIY